MGPGAVAGALLLFLVAAGTAGASHSPPVGDDEIDHLMLRVDELGPGETMAFDVISSTHGDPRPGWIYSFFGKLEGNNSIEVRLLFDDEVLDEYTWDPGQVTMDQTKIQTEGRHQIVLDNPGDESVWYTFYYDQSCNCESKRIPFPGGSAIFNYPFQGGSTVQISYPLVEDWHVYGALAAYDDSLPSADWPDDFTILQEKEAHGPGKGVEGWGWLNFTFSPEETGMYYVYLEALSEFPTPAQGGQGLILSSMVDLIEEPKEAPAVPFALLGVVLMALVAVTRFRKNG